MEFDMAKTNNIKPPFTEASAGALVAADNRRTQLHQRQTRDLANWTEDRITTHFTCEWQDSVTGRWFRTEGEETWGFDPSGHLRQREITASDTPISADERRLGGPGAPISEPRDTHA